MERKDKSVTTVPVVWQYAILAAVTLAVVFVFLALYNRREARRRHAIELSRLMVRWGLDWLAELYEMYAVGDYSWLAQKIKEVVQAVRSDEAMVRILWEATLKVAAYCVANEPDKAAKLRRILEDSKDT